MASRLRLPGYWKPGPCCPSGSGVHMGSLQRLSVASVDAALCVYKEKLTHGSSGGSDNRWTVHRCDL